MPDDDLAEMIAGFHVLERRRCRRIVEHAVDHRPQYMLLDEPSLGLAPIIVQQIFGFITHYSNSRQTTVVLAEHLGDVSILYLRVEGVSELLNAKVATAHQAQCAAGQTVGLAPDASWALTFDADRRLLTR